MAVGASAAIAVVEPTAAIAVPDEKVRCTEVVAGTDACAEVRYHRVTPVQRGLGRGKAVAGLVTDRPAGIRLQDRATERAWQGDPAGEAWPVEQAEAAWPETMPQLPTATGTPSEVSGAATMAGVADFTAAEAMVGAVGAMAGVGIPSGTGRRTGTTPGGMAIHRPTFTRIRTSKSGSRSYPRRKRRRLLSSSRISASWILPMDELLLPRRSSSGRSRSCRHAALCRVRRRRHHLGRRCASLPDAVVNRKSQ